MANLFTPLHSETRLDYFGQPYTVHVLGRKPDLSKLWKSFAEVQLQNQRNLKLGSVSQSWTDREILKEEIKTQQ